MSASQGDNATDLQHVLPPDNEERQESSTELLPQSKVTSGIDRSLITTADVKEDDDLQGLDVQVYNRAELESGIIGQVEAAFETSVGKKTRKRKTAKRSEVSAHAFRKASSVEQPCSSTSEVTLTPTSEVSDSHSTDVLVGKRNTEPVDDLLNTKNDASSQLIRQGDITPFQQARLKQKLANDDQKPSTSGQLTDFEMFLLDEASKTKIRHKAPKRVSPSTTKAPAKTKVVPNASLDPQALLGMDAVASNRLTSIASGRGGPGDGSNWFDEKKRMKGRTSSDSMKPPAPPVKRAKSSPNIGGSIFGGKRKRSRQVEVSMTSDDVKEDSGVLVRAKRPPKESDDGSDRVYRNRMKEYRKRKLQARYERIQQDLSDHSDSDDGEEVELDGGLLVPGALWNRLYKYQKTGVRWLWELYQQGVGGIVGDEMGLGKTIQVLVFLAALEHSQIRDISTGYKGKGPVLIISPSTMMHQWVRECHTWCPKLRIAVLHGTGSFTGSKKTLAQRMIAHKAVLVTSYTSFTQLQDIFLDLPWHYVILDEGHKIRNPQAQVTVAVKKLNTPHRVILSGSPMQNSLQELWSLFDFVNPGLLGALDVFVREFGVPITQGGYANASKVQVQTAYRCACILRDTISPYLLRRLKADVQQSIALPSKNEQVLFCNITACQRQLYKAYLNSRECSAILGASMDPFSGLIILRKLCNHPDLVDGGPNRLGDLNLDDHPSAVYGHYSRSGKLVVVKSLLKLWAKQGHRVLLFSQSRQMLYILEEFSRRESYTYLRMDGGTGIGVRQSMVNRFNEDRSIFLFLLTTRVGGLGLNLVGADRVLIFDPDWNPSTDTQAKERAWRIGQDKPVTIYRLVTSGTIEEKMYQRQIFKQFLTNRVLKDPRQRRFFKTNDLHELFTLADEPAPNATGGNYPSETVEIVGDDDLVVKKEDLERQKTKNTGSESNLSDAVVAEDRAQPSCSRHDTSEKKRIAEQLAKSVGKTGAQPLGKRKHRPKAKIDGKSIKGLRRKEKYRQTNDGDDDQEKTADDDYVLRKLFKKSSGITSAVHHDGMMAYASQPDADLVQGEADRVARQAARALAESRRLAKVQHQKSMSRLRFSVQRSKRIPSSHSKKASEEDKFLGEVIEEADKTGLSSTDLLSRIKDRKRRHGAQNEDGSSSDSDALDGPDAGQESPIVQSQKPTVPMEASLQSDSQIALRDASASDSIDSDKFELLSDLRNFIAFQSGHEQPAATTQELLARFGGRIGGTDCVYFRSVLREICTFKRSESLWVLRKEYE